MRELLKLKFLGEFDAASDVVLKSLKKKKDNKQLEVLSNYLSTSYVYVTTLEMQLQEANHRLNNLAEKRDEELRAKEDYKELYEKLQQTKI